MAWIVGSRPTMTKRKNATRADGEDASGLPAALRLTPLEVPALRSRFGRNDSRGVLPCRHG